MLAVSGSSRSFLKAVGKPQIGLASGIRSERVLPSWLFYRSRRRYRADPCRYRRHTANRKYSWAGPDTLDPSEIYQPGRRMLGYIGAWRRRCTRQGRMGAGQPKPVSATRDDRDG